MGPVALLVFKTSAPANTGLVGSTPTRLRQPSSKYRKIRDYPLFSSSYTDGMKHARLRWKTTKTDSEVPPTLPLDFVTKADRFYRSIRKIGK